MGKILWILVLLTPLMYAKTLSATYDVSFGVFQRMGTAEAKLQINDDQTYLIRVEAKTLGVAKVLSNNRYEVYESRGYVKDGKLIPETYMELRQSNSKKTTTYYTFDHQKKIVLKEKRRVEDGKENRSRDQNDFYAQEDILSLFFNLKNYTKKRENVFFTAIGGNKKDGRIDAVFPRKEELEEMKKTLGISSGEFLKVILNDRIFASANGELSINLDSDGLCEKAVLEDVLLFGDIVGKRVHSLTFTQ